MDGWPAPPRGPRARAGRSGGRHCGCSSPIVKPARQWAARGGTCSPERPINRSRVQLPSRPSPWTRDPSAAAPAGGGSRPLASERRCQPGRAAWHRRALPSAPARPPLASSLGSVLHPGLLCPGTARPSHRVSCRAPRHPRAKQCSLGLAFDPDSWTSIVTVAAVYNIGNPGKHPPGSTRLPTAPPGPRINNPASAPQAAVRCPILLN